MDLQCFVDNLLTSWYFMFRVKLTDIMVLNICSLQYSIRNVFVDNSGIILLRIKYYIYINDFLQYKQK